MDQTPAPESWRIVVFTNIPGGMIYSLVDEVVRPLGHRVVGVVTSPGPKRRRSPTYLEVVAAVPPGVDVIVSNHPERWAAMLAPLRARSDHQRWLPLAHPRRRPRAASARRDQFPRRPPAAAPRTERDRLGLPHGRHRDGPDHPPPHPGVRHRPDPGAGARPDYRRRRHDDARWPNSGPLPRHSSRRRWSGWREAIQAMPRTESQATEAGLFEDAWRIIDWSQPARTIHNQVRSWVGLRDIPLGALGEIDGETLQITKTRLVPDGSDDAGASATRHGRAPGRRASGRAMWRRTDRDSRLVSHVTACR